MNIVGTKINGYFFREAIGSGSFGSVYKAEKDGVFYAAKILSETYILDEFKNDDNRVNREIEVLKRVSSPHLISYKEEFFFINEFGINEYVIIMEYFDGVTLKDYLKQNITFDELINIFNKVLTGVSDLHKTIVNNEGIVHRDLKPANIMVDNYGNIKIIDYGLSKIVDFSSLTSTGMQIGSPLYMSPEQLKDSKRIDYRSDIYALGIIMYEMLTRNIPYKANTLPELMLKILNEPITPPKQYNDDISDNLEKIIYKATSKEIYGRFQTVDEFIEAFSTENVQDDLKIIGEYYAWVYKEKAVTLEMTKDSQMSIIYPIHVKDWSKGLHKHLSSDGFENTIIDPSTQRLSYLAFASTKGLTGLPYAPNEGVISLEYLQNPVKRLNYIVEWYEHVSIGKNLILPYHYISNTNYSVDKIEEWVKINVQLISESLSVLRNGEKSYAMISIGLNVSVK